MPLNILIAFVCVAFAVMGLLVIWIAGLDLKDPPRDPNDPPPPRFPMF